MTELKDHTARARALDATQSFIVQAPAGSGKTGLLVRRYLVLLARVEDPEEVLAITFTNKATAEMQERILGAINTAASDREFADKDQDLEPLARAVLERDRAKSWGLRENPARLCILTIDALCMQLVRSMPWSSRYTGAPEIVQGIDCEAVYQSVARDVLRLADHDDADDNEETDSMKVRQFIELVNGDLERATRLLTAMLKKRDLWLRGIPGLNIAELTAAWEEEASALMQTAAAYLEPEAKGLVDALRYAAGHVADGDVLAACRDLNAWPEADHAALAQWHGIAKLLLTQSNRPAFRKKVDKRLGFPTPKDGGDAEKKEAIEGILIALAENAPLNAPLLESLDALRLLPVTGFDARQHQSVDAIVRVIHLAVAHLKLHFSHPPTADFVEISQRAELALKQEGEPTDLALAFGYRLRHILMDEVQDTSRAQLDLFKLLTWGWEPGDGRTLFFVGDPMQSIYRFREAEVRNFHTIIEDGIGAIHPEYLQLQSNFRSTADIVDWFNTTFKEIFPQEYDADDDVPYSPADPVRQWDPVSGCELLCRSSSNWAVAREIEAVEIRQRIAELLTAHPEFTIGVLARSRSHLQATARELRQSGIGFEAVELESLNHRPPVLDLFALTRALHNPSDRIAWLAVLRGPWCGLTLADLTALTETDTGADTDTDTDTEATIPTLMAQRDLSGLSADGRQRLEVFHERLAPVLADLGRQSLYHSVLAAWLRIGGPATVDATDSADCETYLSLLRQLKSTTPLTVALLEQRVDCLWSIAAGGYQVKLMTIHKAKGLEFDAVFIPSLERGVGRDEAELLRWQRRGQQAPLVAPLAYSDEQQDGFNRYLKKLEKRYQRNELKRLLYVVCTRARTKLFLSANLKLNASDEPGKPLSDTLLELLWPTMQDAFIAQATTIAADAQIPAGSRGNQLRRVPLDFIPPAPPVGVATGAQTATDIPEPGIEFSWSGEVVRIAGIAIHAMLQQITPDHWPQWKKRNPAMHVRALVPILRENGLHGRNLELAKKSIRKAIANLRLDPQADWIFSAQHRAIKTEWAVTGVVDGTTVNVIMDRCFIDRDGTRWIIDYKSSRHEQDDRGDFLDQELVRYTHQLQRYVTVANLYQPMPTRAALYFPLLQGWRELTLQSA